MLQIQKETPEILSLNGFPRENALLWGLFLLVLVIVFFHVFLDEMGAFRVHCWKEKNNIACTTQLVGYFGLLKHRTKKHSSIRTLRYNQKIEADDSAGECGKYTIHEVLQYQQGKKKASTFWRESTCFQCVCGDAKKMNLLVDGFREFKTSSKSGLELSLKNWSSEMVVFLVFVLFVTLSASFSFLWSGLVWQSFIFDRNEKMLQIEKWCRFRWTKREVVLPGSWSFQIEAVEGSGNDEENEDSESLYRLELLFSEGNIEISQSKNQHALMNLQKAIDDFLRNTSEHRRD